MNKKTLILGASSNPARYAHIASGMLKEYGHPVVEVGRRDGGIGEPEGIDTVTMYLNERNQAAYEDDVITLKPKRVIFNPGSENPDFAKRLTENGIEVLHACTLVMLRSNQY